MGSNEPNGININREAPPQYRLPDQTNWGGDPYGMNKGAMPYQPTWGDPFMVNPSVLPYQPAWGTNQTSWGGGDPYMMNPSASQFQPPWGRYQENFNSYDEYRRNSNPNPIAYPNTNQYFSYMKKSAPASRTVIQQEEVRGFQETSQWVDPSYYDPYGTGYGYGFPYGGAPAQPPPQEPKKPKSPPPPPPPMESDYLNFFDAYDREFRGYGYGYESMGSSPDSSEVRQREGIPDLEEETETDSHYEEAAKENTFSKTRNLGNRKVDIDGSSWKEASTSADESSRRPARVSEATAKAAHDGTNLNSFQSENNEGLHSVDIHPVDIEVDKHSSETIVSQNMDDGHEGKKGVSFDLDEGSTQEFESSILSSLTTLSPHGSRNLQEVVSEIKDEFETAFSYGKEVALMLEAGKLPYHSRFAVFKVVLSKILYPLAPSMASSDDQIQSVKSSSWVAKLAVSYIVDAVPNIGDVKLSSTLEKLYAWEKKLYKLRWLLWF